MIDEHQPLFEMRRVESSLMNSPQEHRFRVSRIIAAFERNIRPTRRKEIGVNSFAMAAMQICDALLFYREINCDASVDELLWRFSLRYEGGENGSESSSDVLLNLQIDDNSILINLFIKDLCIIFIIYYVNYLTQIK